MKPPLPNCDHCGVGITSITHRINCGYCLVCWGGSSEMFYHLKTLHGPADADAVTAELTRRDDKLLLQHWQRVLARLEPGDELLEFCCEKPDRSLIWISSGVLWRRADELLSVIPLDINKESRSWREPGEDAEEFRQTRFATSQEIAACGPILARLRPGDRVIHYKNQDLEGYRRLLANPDFNFTEGRAEIVRAVERQQAVILMEGRTGLLLIRDWRCVLRVCTDSAPEEEPF